MLREYRLTRPPRLRTGGACLACQGRGSILAKRPRGSVSLVLRVSLLDWIWITDGDQNAPVGPIGNGLRVTEDCCCGTCLVWSTRPLGSREQQGSPTEHGCRWRCCGQAGIKPRGFDTIQKDRASSLLGRRASCTDSFTKRADIERVMRTCSLVACEVTSLRIPFAGALICDEARL